MVRSISSLEFALRWTVRVLSVVLVGLALAIYVGEGGFNPLRVEAEHEDWNA
jgi:hypothetical protein